MHTFIVIVHVLVCLFMIAVVLLQSGKSDMGSGFGGGGSQAVLTAQSGTTLLGKITAGAAIMFMVTSTTLAWFSNSQAQSKSVIQDDIVQQLDQAAAEEKAKVEAEEKARAAAEAAAAAAAAAPAPEAGVPGAEGAPVPVEGAAPIVPASAPEGAPAPAGEPAPPGGN